MLDALAGRLASANCATIELLHRGATNVARDVPGNTCDSGSGSAGLGPDGAGRVCPADARRGHGTGPRRQRGLQGQAARSRCGGIRARHRARASQSGFQLREPARCAVPRVPAERANRARREARESRSRRRGVTRRRQRGAGARVRRPARGGQARVLPPARRRSPRGVRARIERGGHSRARRGAGARRLGGCPAPGSRAGGAGARARRERHRHDRR